MRIVALEIKGLYGTLTKAIEFHKDLNLLVGINGSGKTSVLNCIDWMLRPDFTKLSATQFDSIKLTLINEGRTFQLLATQDARRLTYSEPSRLLEAGNITVDFVKHPKDLKTKADVDEACAHYKTLGPDPPEQALWGFLEKLPHPLTVTLDRSISAEVNDEILYERNERLRYKKSTASSPIAKVVDVTRQRYAAYREKIGHLNEELKTKLILSAFRDPFALSKNSSTKKISPIEISRLEEKVEAVLRPQLTDKGALKNVKAYFRTAKDFGSRFGNDKAMRQIFWSQFRQIDDLTEIFNAYDQFASVASEPLDSYLKALNLFFVESHKRLAFNDHDGTLSFQYLDAKGVPSGAYRSVDRLSSGERQILILITLLAFMLGEDQVFVVDEPELSLHPKWQQNLLPAIIDQTPKGTQLILATHSPEIVGKYRDSCILLDG